jgi:hypothetical protein
MFKIDCDDRAGVEVAGAGHQRGEVRDVADDVV